MPETIAAKIFEIIAEQAILQVSDLTPDQTLADIGMDSLALVECIFAIEEAFDIDVPFNANDPKGGEFDISTLSTIVSAVEKLVADQKT